jgi:PAS domain S-box-containing protein
VLAPTTTDLEQLRARLAAVSRLVSPLIVADQHGLIRYVDAPLARDLEWQVDDLVGRPLTAIIPRRFHDAHHLGFSRFLTTGERVVLERPLALWVTTKSGGELRVEHVITAIRRLDGWLFGAAIRTRGSGDD